jgi:hypothetical protein
MPSRTTRFLLHRQNKAPPRAFDVDFSRIIRGKGRADAAMRTKPCCPRRAATPGRLFPLQFQCRASPNFAFLLEIVPAVAVG